MPVFVGEELPPEHPDSSIDINRWETLAEATLELEKAPKGELNLIFVDENRMSELNEIHLGKQGPTDVLAFPIDTEESKNSQHPQLLGDVVICPTVARENAKTQEKKYEDELALLVVHGILHILGYDHAYVHESKIMKSRERELLADLYSS